MQEDPHRAGSTATGMVAMPASDDIELGEGTDGEEVDLDASVDDMDGDEEDDESGAISADE
jgi:hypothetical protein